MQRRNFLKSCSIAGMTLSANLEFLDAQPKNKTKKTSILLCAPQATDPYYREFFDELL